MKNQYEEVTEHDVNISINQGLFGEMENCVGVYERIDHPESGGTFVKPIGNTMLFKGDPDQHRVNGMLLAKSMVSNIPRVIFGKSYIMAAALALQFLLSRQTFLYLAHNYIEEIMRKCVAFLAIPYDHYNKFEKEIMRSMGIAVRAEYGISDVSVEQLMNIPVTGSEKLRELGAIVILKFTAFFCVFLANDAAYRFRIQDVFGTMHFSNWPGLTHRYVQTGKQKILWMLDAMIEREQAIKYKLRFFRRLVALMFFVSPRARRIADNFFMNLKLEDVMLDEDDWYYCLRRPSYNYRGWTIERRLEEYKRIDAEKGHWYPKIIYEPPK